MPCLQGPVSLSHVPPHVRAMVLRLAAIMGHGGTVHARAAPRVGIFTELHGRRMALADWKAFRTHGHTASKQSGRRASGGPSKERGWPGRRQGTQNASHPNAHGTARWSRTTSSASLEDSPSKSLMRPSKRSCPAPSTKSSMTVRSVSRRWPRLRTGLSSRRRASRAGTHRI